MNQGSPADFRCNASSTRPPNILAIANRGLAGDVAEQAIDQAGVRPVGRIEWSDAATRLGDHPLVDLILVEAEGVDTDLMEAVLPRVDTLARATDARIVAAIDAGQIDTVAAHLWGPHVQLFCAPSLTERVAAISLAGMASATLPDSIREAESERLRRLNEEVARIAQTLARLATREDLPSLERTGIVGDRRDGFAASPPATSAASRPVDPQDVRRAIRSRRLREQFFASALIEDPGWDMLLDLFAAELEDRGVSVSSLCIAAAVAPTTALRWIGKMSEAGLFDRRPDPFDRRRAFMTLTDTARQAMHRYCRAVQEAGLSIA